MSLYRVFHGALADSEATVVLDAAESHHLLRVRRARTGDAVDVFDGQGNIARGSLGNATGNRAQIEIDEIGRATAPFPAIHLLLPLAKAKAFENVVQKATELGVSEIHPVHTRHCEVDISADRAANKLEKWEAIALESLKQCGNPFLPRIHAPRPLPEVIRKTTAAETEAPPLRLVAALHPDARPIKRCLGDIPPVSSVHLLLGPEGDLSPEEYAGAFAAGFLPFTLGPQVLRVDTAAIAAIALIMDHFRG
ncbi:MAG: 16S rRNA (uracil(1498)-N(3))-methyltransferase [Opitutales bacterium]|nr:16S rRNA (uracil(1498)-N(3))-methyltransferase [Opitutales bacterium]